MIIFEDRFHDRVILFVQVMVEILVATILIIIIIIICIDQQFKKCLPGIEGTRARRVEVKNQSLAYNSERL